MGIGVICHEFSHCLGLPDFYDTVGDNYGMGYFDIMCSGSYNGPNYIGEVPAGYTSYERMFVGWMDPEELESTKNVSGMKPITEQGEAYKITNPGCESEYFLFENRQKTGWDSYIPSAGLMVTHVDYDSDVWDWNVVNSVGGSYYLSTDTDQKNELKTDHQYLTILHADNKSGQRTYTNMIISDEKNDLYPYATNDSITEYSKPGFTLYNANTDGSFVLHSIVRDIRQNSDGTMDFNFYPDVAAGIEDVVSASDDDVVAVYNLRGQKYPSAEQLPSGVYILKLRSGESRKVVVK